MVFPYSEKDSVILSSLKADIPQENQNSHNCIRPAVSKGASPWWDLQAPLTTVKYLFNKSKFQSQRSSSYKGWKLIGKGFTFSFAVMML